jgi:predicted enzyme related to lactoylglutathione lyase
MAKVLGIGGVFFKTVDQAALKDWHQRVLGLDITDWGGAWFAATDTAAWPGAGTVFSAMKADTDYFAPSDAPFMINLMVDDLDAMLARCAEHGVTPVKVFPDEPNGRFAHILDPEGRKIELWQPKPMAEA